MPPRRDDFDLIGGIINHLLDESTPKRTNPGRSRHKKYLIWQNFSFLTMVELHKIPMLTEFPTLLMIICQWVKVCQIGISDLSGCQERFLHLLTWTQVLLGFRGVRFRPKESQRAPNKKKNLGLFQIIFQFILAHRNRISKMSQICPHLGSIWPTYGPYLNPC